MHSRALRFSPSGVQLAGLDALAGATAVTLSMLLRFFEEGSVPATYAQRLVPWVLFAAVLQVVSGEVITRLRKPGSVLSNRPVAPFLVAALLSVLVVVAINELILREPWRLPRTVSVMAPLLAAAASAALRMAAARSIAVEELLTRPVVRLDTDACSAALGGKRVLITGGAGSIGSELARLAIRFGPASLVVMDVNETGLFEIEAELSNLASSVPLHTSIADVTDPRRVREVFQRERPDVVFHAAAYKHVPLLEANPDQGFVTNVLGTLAVCEAAVAAGAERVVVISTDKAVNPSSFMGLTKRAAELIVIALSQVPPPVGRENTILSAVRFGNVLGSRGSVVPTLMRQIEAGGPITITHPDAQRFFMTMSEAASLVLLSAAFGTPGGVFVLDMGDEVRVGDLAERLARLKGLRLGRDVGVSYIGLRPGEKLREELVADGERLEQTNLTGIHRVEASHALDGAALVDGIRELDARRQRGELAVSDYPVELRSLIDRALQLLTPA